jgi:hypothetical protein
MDVSCLFDEISENKTRNLVYEITSNKHLYLDDTPPAEANEIRYY